MNLQDDVVALLVETNHNSVLYKCKSFTSGNATARGLLNTAVRFIPVKLLRYSSLKTIDWAKEFYTMDIKGTIEPMPEYLITDDYLKLKYIASVRAECLWALELYLQEGISRVIDYYDDNLSAFLVAELNKCNPAEDYYTDAIHEYADIAEIEPKYVYQEMSMTVNTAGLVRLRNKAIYDKYVIKFGSANSREECDELIKQALEDAYRKHRL
jgi:hypothetical protein